MRFSPLGATHVKEKTGSRVARILPRQQRASPARRWRSGLLRWRCGLVGACWLPTEYPRDFAKIAEDCTPEAAKVPGFREDSPKVAKIAQVARARLLRHLRAGGDES
jgi:hypothetical protein